MRKHQRNTKTFSHTESEIQSRLCQRKRGRGKKQRIVKITEYPESPEKNTVEISNARKTFAEIQKEETAAATEEAVSISNRATKKKSLRTIRPRRRLKPKSRHRKRAVEAGVAYTLKNYYTSGADGFLDKSHERGDFSRGKSMLRKTQCTTML